MKGGPAEVVVTEPELAEVPVAQTQPPTRQGSPIFLKVPYYHKFKTPILDT